MQEAVSMKTERMDGRPLLLTHMQRMHLAAVLDTRIPTHGQRNGLRVGERSVVWLAPFLAQADHRMNCVQEWATRQLGTVRGCGKSALCLRDVTDDRLADVLCVLSADVHWHAYEQELMGHQVRVSDVPATCGRIDTTTASSAADGAEHGLPWGHSNDHCPALPQRMLVRASLDPLGLPLAPDMLSGEHVDDPVSVPISARVRDGLLHRGLLDVGDGTMATLQMRASHAAQGDVSLCHLSALQTPPEHVSQDVDIRHEGVPVIEVCCRDEQGASTCRAQGDDTVQVMTAQVDGETLYWQERRVVIQSRAARSAAHAHVHERVQKAQQERADPTTRRQGKPRLTTHTEVDEAIKAVLTPCRVEGVRQAQIHEDVHERPGRTSRGRVSGVRRDRPFRLSCERVEMAMVRAMNQLGWRVSATTHPAHHLTVEQAGEASRDDHLVERTFARLTGHPLSPAPLSVQRDDHRVGLVRVLTLALRVLTVLEGVVRQRLGERSGLFAGNPTRPTARPPVEHVLEAFCDVTVTVISPPGFAQRHVTPLSPLHQQMLALCGFSPGFADDSSYRPEIEANGKVQGYPCCESDTIQMLRDISPFPVAVSCPTSQVIRKNVRCWEGERHE